MSACYSMSSAATQTLFMRRDEVEAAWAWVEPILDEWTRYRCAGQPLSSRHLGAFRGGRPDGARRPQLGGPRNLMNDRRFETELAMAEALASDIAQALAPRIAETGSASLILSGGRTPGSMLDRLSRLPLPWNRVKITLADERLVPATDPESNERLLRDRLLRGEAQAAVFIPLWQGEGDPVESAIEAVCNMERPFAMVVLGLGDDGHVASLFPGCRALAVRSIPLPISPQSSFLAKPQGGPASHSPWQRF